MASVEDAILVLFQSLLRRDPKPEEVKAALARIANGQDVADVALWIGNSLEGKRYRTPLFVPPGHFYSPIVDTTLVADQVPRVRPTPPDNLPDVNIDIERMERFWIQELAPHAHAAPFPNEPKAPFRYHFKNPAYSYGDAIALRAMLLHFRPRRLIEVGSGWSSACTLDTLFDEVSLDTEVTFVEPHPKLLETVITPADRSRVRVLAVPVQSVSLQEFERLESNDILFIDSMHVVKTKSDVVFELCEVLPRLKPGVVVHFHDIFYPFEYSYEWAVEQNRSWNEIYALRNFLAFNYAFQVIFFNDMFVQLRRGILERTCPRFLKNTGGAIWLRRVE